MFPYDFPSSINLLVGVKGRYIHTCGDRAAGRYRVFIDDPGLSIP